MIRRILIVLLTLATLLPANAMAETTENETGRLPETAEEFLFSANPPNRAAATAIILNVHAYFNAKTAQETTQRVVDRAKDALEDARLALKMGNATALEVEAAEVAMEIASLEFEKATITLMKTIMTVKADAGWDMQKLSLSQEEFFLLCKPEDMPLKELLVWAGVTDGAGGADADPRLVLTVEQYFLDIKLAYISVSSQAAALTEIVARREEISLGVIMGKNTNAELKAVSEEMKRSRSDLMNAISAYSELLYQVNETCRGEIAETAGVLTPYVGRFEEDSYLVETENAELTDQEQALQEKKEIFNET